MPACHDCGKIFSGFEELVNQNFDVFVANLVQVVTIVEKYLVDLKNWCDIHFESICIPKIYQKYPKKN